MTENQPGPRPMRAALDSTNVVAQSNAAKAQQHSCAAAARCQRAAQAAHDALAWIERVELLGWSEPPPANGIATPA